MDRSRGLKIVTLLAVLVFMIAVITACAASEDAPGAASPDLGEGSDAPEGESSHDFENKELSVAVFEGGYGKAYWEEVIQRFEEDYPGVKVNLTSNPKIMDIIKPQLVSGNPPDFIYMPLSDETNTIQTMIKEKALLDLTDVFESQALDQDAPLKDVMTDGILEYAKPHGDGNIYYAPFYTSNMGLWYNQTLFEEKGWEVPETWDDFFALGEKAKQEGRALFTYQGLHPGYNESIIFPAIASAGGVEAIEKIENYEENAYDNDAVRKVFEIYEMITEKDYLMPGTVALNHTQAQTEFLQGKALFIPNGDWFEGEMVDAPREDGFEFGFMAPPVFEAGDQRYAQTSFEGLFIPKDAKNPELAKEFLKYQYQDEIVKLNAEKASGVLAVKNGAELARDFVPESIYNAAKVFDEGVQPIIFQWAVTPSTEIVIKDELFNPIGEVMNQKMTVDEWIDRVETANGKLRDLIE